MERTVVMVTSMWGDVVTWELQMDCILQHIPRDIDQDALTDALSSRNTDVLSFVAAAIGHLGIRSKKVIDQLSAILVEGDECEQDFYQIAALALGKIWGNGYDAAAFESLIQDLQDESIQARARAAAILGSIQSVDRIASAVAALQRALDDPVFEIRRIATYSLGQLGQLAIPALIECMLTSADPSLELVDAIVSIGGPVTTDLMQIYGECAPETRWWILWAIGKIHNNPTQTIPFLLQAMDDPSVRIRFYVPHALKEYGSDAAGAVPRLLHALTHEYGHYTKVKKSEYYTTEELREFHIKEELEAHNMEAVSDIVEVLGAIGPSARPGIPCLIDLFEKEKDARIRLAAFKAICTIGPSEQEHLKLIDYLMDSGQVYLKQEDHPNGSTKGRRRLTDYQLDNTEEQEWFRMVEVLLSAPLSKPMLNRLVDFFLRADVPGRQHKLYRSLAQAIGRSNANNCIGVITEALDAGDDQIVERAIWLLSYLSDMAVKAVRDLVSTFDRVNNSVRRRILYALECIGETELVLPVLLEALQHEALRERAAETVARVGIRSNELLSNLREGMIHWSGRSRLSAAFAVCKLDPTAEEPLQLLEACLNSEEERRCSLDLLIEIGKPALRIVMNAFRNSELNAYVHDYFIHEQSAMGFVTPEEFAPELLSFLNSRDACLREEGAYLAGMFPVGPENAKMIERR